MCSLFGTAGPDIYSHSNTKYRTYPIFTRAPGFYVDFFIDNKERSMVISGYILMIFWILLVAKYPMLYAKFELI